MTRYETVVESIVKMFHVQLKEFATSREKVVDLSWFR